MHVIYSTVHSFYEMYAFQTMYFWSIFLIKPRESVKRVVHSFLRRVRPVRVDDCHSVPEYYFDRIKPNRVIYWGGDNLSSELCVFSLAQTATSCLFHAAPFHYASVLVPRPRQLRISSPSSSACAVIQSVFPVLVSFCFPPDEWNTEDMCIEWWRFYGLRFPCLVDAFVLAGIVFFLEFNASRNTLWRCSVSYPVCVCVCVCLCLFAIVYVSVYVCIYVCMYACMHTSIYV